MKSITMLTAAVLLGALCACDGSTYVPKKPEVHVINGTVVALPPRNCPNWSDGGTTNFDNSSWENFGCADAANLARQVENPADLVRGQGSNSLDGDRNSVAITKYKTDTVTQTTTESASGGGQ